VGRTGRRHRRDPQDYVAGNVGAESRAVGRFDLGNERHPSGGESQDDEHGRQEDEGEYEPCGGGSGGAAAPSKMRPDRERRRRYRPAHEQFPREQSRNRQGADQRRPSPSVLTPSRPLHGQPGHDQQPGPEGSARGLARGVRLPTDTVVPTLVAIHKVATGNASPQVCAQPPEKPPQRSRKRDERGKVEEHGSRGRPGDRVDQVAGQAFDRPVHP
jgi:hypothetical protein